jgi:hypothetical protein
MITNNKLTRHSINDSINKSEKIENKIEKSVKYAREGYISPYVLFVVKRIIKHTKVSKKY